MTTAPRWKMVQCALDDFEMNVTNVTHWIFAPEVRDG